MASTVTRKIVRIDPDKCDGCGACVPSCAEGAIEIIDGKARLAAENLCDGLGNCLGTCPRDAITIEERPAEAFDEEAVRAHLGGAAEAAPAAEPAGAMSGCPGAAARRLRPGGAAAAPTRPAPKPAGGGESGSQLGHWPVQLALLPPTGAMWADADVLIAADCVGFAVPDFHQRLLTGKTLAVACPKLDDTRPYIAKLAQVFSGNRIRSLTVAHMEVPCCTGIVHVVRTALEQAGRADIPLTEITVGLDGSIQSVR